MTSGTSERGRVRTTTIAAALLTLLLAVCSACSSSGDPTASASTSAIVTSLPTVTRGTTPDGAALPRTRLDGFGEVTVKVRDADGVEREHCLLLADTDELRERGLMFVEDPTLGGYDGMLFLFAEDTSSAFWMKNTRLPLSIAYVAETGRTVSTTDMAPCPDTVRSCPSYPPGGSYRYAVEVPQGELGAVGLSDRSTMTVGAHTCAGLPPD